MAKTPKFQIPTEMKTKISEEETVSDFLGEILDDSFIGYFQRLLEKRDKELRDEEKEVASDEQSEGNSGAVVLPNSKRR